MVGVGCRRPTEETRAALDPPAECPERGAGAAQRSHLCIYIVFLPPVLRVLLALGNSSKTVSTQVGLGDSHPVCPVPEEP